MGRIVNAIIGNLGEKKRFRANEKRARALPAEYAEAYKEIRDYLWRTSGLLTYDPLVSLVDMLEEAAADGKSVISVTGPDVAAFADELVRGESTYQDNEREKLNNYFLGISGKDK